MFKTLKNRSPVNKQQFTFKIYKISTLYNVKWRAIPLLRCTVFK